MQVGYEKSLFSTNASLYRVLSTARPSRVVSVVTLIAGSSKRQLLLIEGDE